MMVMAVERLIQEVHAVGTAMVMVVMMLLSNYGSCCA
jgi:hypothetical protein